MKLTKASIILRYAVAIIFLSHSLHGIFTGNDVNDFGNFFLNKIGFAPFGVYIAWSVVISQVITSCCLMANKYVNISCVVNVLILLAGIVTVHFKEGWFVVGGGRNGMEFSFLLISVLFAIMAEHKKSSVVGHSIENSDKAST